MNPGPATARALPKVEPRHVGDLYNSRFAAGVPIQFLLETLCFRVNALRCACLEAPRPKRRDPSIVLPRELHLVLLKPGGFIHQQPDARAVSIDRDVDDRAVPRRDVFACELSQLGSLIAVEYHDRNSCSVEERSGRITNYEHIQRSESEKGMTARSDRPIKVERVFALVELQDRVVKETREPALTGGAGPVTTARWRTPPPAGREPECTACLRDRAGFRTTQSVSLAFPRGA
jgi:hypothetical protein